MKSFTVFTSVLFLFFLTTLSSCKKPDKVLSNQELIAGKWEINGIRVNILSNGMLIKDSLLPANPQPENFIEFNGSESFEYCFNKPVADIGNYQFVTNDSVYAYIGNDLFKWKILLLTKEIFNVENTQPYQNIPGATLVTYQTFIRK